MEKNLEELEIEVTCDICHEHYTDPKILPCLHYYCKQCIHTLALRTGIDKPFSCPECRTDTTLPQGGIDHLKPAFFVNRMKSIHSNLSKVHGKVEAMCESCSENRAEAFCRQCEQFICAECVRLHQKLKIFSGHKTVSLDELKQGGAKDIVVPEASLKMCKKHDEQMKIYCFDCNSLICRDCIIKDHNGHNHEFIKEAAPKVKKELLEQLDPLKDVKVNLSQAVDEINIVKSEVKVQVDASSKCIKNSFNELRQILANREQELLKETTAKGAQKLDLLSAQEKKLSTSHTVVQSVIEYTEQCLEHSADDEIMCMRVEMQSRIDREIQEQQKEGENLAPVEEADMGVEVSCAEDLKQLCHTKAKLTQLAVVYTMTGEGIKSAEVNKISEFSMVAKLSNGDQIRRKLPLECRLKSLAKGVITKCQVDFVKGNNYRIQYTPTVRGRHEVVLTARGQEIAGSPFPVFVSIHPTQMVKPVRTIKVDVPIHIAVNSAGEVIIIGGTEVVVYDREGTRLHVVNMWDVYGRNPWGLAVDSEDYIYICCKSTIACELLKLSPKLKLVKRTNDIGGAFFKGVSIVGDELMVLNSKNDSITTFNTELEFVRKVGVYKEGKQVLGGIPFTQDNHGNLYVVYKDSSIHVFTNRGKFLRSFAVKNLADPHEMCIFGEYIYITDYKTNVVLVYTTEGEHVTTFNQFQCGFKSPWGICADKDGFIYVCNHGNNRVVVM